MYACSINGLTGIGSPRASSLDYLVGTGEDRVRNPQAESPRSLEIDDQLEFRWAKVGHLAGMRPFEDAVDLTCQITVIFGEVDPIRHEAADIDEQAIRID